MIRQTSREAHDSIKKSLTDKQEKVLSFLSNYPCGLTNEEISKGMNWPINSVTPRTGELRAKELILESGLKPGSTGRKAIVWKVRREKPKQLDFFQNVA